MAIDLAHWRMIVECGTRGTVLSAGYPDLLLAQADIAAALHDGSGEIHVRDDSDAIAAHHGWRAPIYDSHEVFAALGCKLFVIDRERREGSETIADLNEPCALGDYDLVIDPGTSEHCFNVAQALVNLAGAVKVGGAICQSLPMSMFNHGYWNVNPVALADFYEVNGFEIERMTIRTPGGLFEPTVAERRMRLKAVPEEAVTLLCARRLEAKPFRWPQQSAP